MLRMTLRLSVTLACLWLLPVMLIRAQPYDDGGLRAFLTTGACAAPCFLSIQPGITPFSEADDLIQAQQWVGSVLRSIDTLSGQPGAVFWTWNGEQPGFFAGSGRGSIRSFNGQRVSEVMVELSPTLGDLWLGLGPPDAYAVTIQGTNFPDMALAFVMLYPDFAILGMLDCPYHENLWQARVVLRLRREQSFTGPFRADNQPMAWRVKQMERGWCGR